MIEQFWLFHCGFLRAPKRLFVTEAGFELGRLPFLAAVAYHRDHGPILVDAPFGHEGPTNAGDILGAFLRKAGLTFRPEWAIIPRIEQLGYRPSEVNHVLTTHLHWDHTGGMKELAHAHFHVRREEWESATTMGPMEARASGYATADFRALGSRVELFDLEEEAALSEPGLDLFGDGSVEAIALPGHSPGHTAYRFHLTDGRRIFFLGDAAYSTLQITRGYSPGLIPRMFASDKERTAATIEKLRAWWRDFAEGSGEVLVSSHDFEWAESCADGPTPLHAT